ncbi:MerR family transcriptional regulator [Nocardiopsis coralliicola]
MAEGRSPDAAGGAAGSGGQARAAAPLTPGAAARALGVAPATLRSWDRRYGIGPQGRSGGGHRRYTAADMQRLVLMCRLVGEGTAPADAARLAGAEPASAPAPPDVPRPAGPGGAVLPSGRDADPALQGLARAAMRLDAEQMDALLERALRERGVVAAWEEIMRPLLYGMGAKWSAARSHVEVEHLLSWSVSSALRRVGRAAGRPLRGTLLACSPNEQHTLPLEALAAALAEQGRPFRMLGASAPADAVAAAVQRTAPAAVVLWSQTAATADTAALGSVRACAARLRQTTAVHTAGPGWSRSGPRGPLLSLPAALHALAPAGRAALARP